MSYGLQIASLVIIFIVVMEFYRYRRLNLLTTKMFEVLIFLSVTSILFKSLCIFSYFNPEHFTILSAKLIHQLFYVTVNINIWMIYMYIDLRTRSIKNYTTPQFVLRILPLFLSFLMVLLGDINYYCELDEAYAYGIIPLSSYFAFSCYFLMIVFLLLRSEHFKEKQYNFEFILFLSIWLVTALVEYLCPYMHLSSASSCVAVLFYYLIFENPKDHTDKDISSAFSRYAFEYTVQEFFKLRRHFWVINFSLQNVEAIRSTYGQKACIECLEKAIQTIPEFKSYNIFRTLEYSFGFIINSKEELNNLYGSYKLSDRTLFLTDYMVAPSFSVCSIECPAIVSSSEGLISLLAFCKNGVESKSGSSIQIIDKSTAEKRNYIAAVESLLQKAVDEDGFEVYYQPIVNSITHKCVYFEALVRLKDKDTLGYISPDVFIPIAEKKGLISQLGDRVMNKVCSFVRKYNLDKQSFVGVGVNLSGFQLQDPSLPYRLHQSVKNYDISTKFINFEITETIAVHSRNAVIAANIEKLKKMGYKFSMDDFGTGYSNFSNMSSINYDLVKIDKSMIWQAFDGKNRKSMTVLISIINMIHSIGCTVVAEGIETESQAEFLRECGIEFLQGFFFSKPLSEDSFLEYLSKMDDESVVSELNILKK